MLPEAASQALAMINQPECSIAKLAAIIEKDVSLASGILSMANSPFYSPGRPIGSIREAVIQIGFRQCHNLIQASCVNSLVQKLSNSRSRSNKILLAHSRITAQVAIELSTVLKLDFNGAEFTTGILHDIGRLLLFSLFAKEYSPVDRVTFEEHDWEAQAEQDAVGTDHCIVGCMFAGLNKLPEPICEAIRFHHTPEKATFSTSLTALTAAADDIANFVIRRDDIENYPAQMNVGLVSLLQDPEVTVNMTPGACLEHILPNLIENLPNIVA